jgi:N-acetylglucosamine-6-phosphate deacetylase
MMTVSVNGRVIGPRGVLNGHCVVIENDRIKQVAPTSQVLWPDDAELLDANGQFVAPGFVDMHVHGAVGCDTMDGSVESLAKIARFHASGGTTALTPTTVTADAGRIAHALETVARARGHDFGGAQIIGAHIEGPYLAPAKRGAHPLSLVRIPDPAEYLPWLEHDDVVTQMTLAPELPGARALIDTLLEHEVLPSGGHTAATIEQAQEAIASGLCHATHLFNCMSSQAKAGAFRLPGALEAFLLDDRVMVELIGDGKHVHPELIKLAIRMKGTDKICLITDAVAGAGLAEGAAFQVGDTTGVVRDGVGMLPDGSALIGSVSTMMQMVHQVVLRTGTSVFDVVRMASLNPARALGLSAHKGSLEPRKDADIVMFTPGFEVTHTLVAGRVEFRRSLAATTEVGKDAGS